VILDRNHREFNCSALSSWFLADGAVLTNYLEALSSESCHPLDYKRRNPAVICQSWGTTELKSPPANNSKSTGVVVKYLFAWMGSSIAALEIDHHQLLDNGIKVILLTGLNLLW